jgi:plasmid stabilization system protein ParE
MAYKIITSTKAEFDVDKAIEYYKDINIQLAKDFLTELKATSKYIQKHPKKIQIRYANIRVAFLKRFPFGVHFRLEDKTISILSILHTSGDPENWER